MHWTSGPTHKAEAINQYSRAVLKNTMCRFNSKCTLKQQTVEVKICAFSTSALDGGEWSVAHYRRSNPGRKIPLLTEVNRAEVEVLADIHFVARLQ